MSTVKSMAATRSIRSRTERMAVLDPINGAAPPGKLLHQKGTEQAAPAAACFGPPAPRGARGASYIQARPPPAATIALATGVLSSSS